MIRIESFEFSKRPSVFRTMHEKGLAQYYLAGELSTPEESQQLEKTIESKTVLDFFNEHDTVKVLVGDQHISRDIVWGLRYELSLLEYRPLHLTRTKLSTNEVDQIGCRMVSPRFRIVADLDDSRDQLPLREVLDYDCDVRIRLDEGLERFKIRFEDQYPLHQGRKDFRRWVRSSRLSIEILLGHLEGDFTSVAKGEVDRIKCGLSGSGNWVDLSGSGKARTRDQEYEYSLREGVNIFDATLGRMPQGESLVKITTALIPDIRPKDSVEVAWQDRMVGDLLRTVDLVEHRVNAGGYRTTITYAEKNENSSTHM